MILSALLGAGLLLAAPGTSKTLDVTTFTVPAGFDFTEAPDHVNFRRVDTGNWILFGVYKGRDASPDLAAEFTTDWNDLFRASGAEAPPSTPRTLSPGVEAREGGVLIPSIGFVHLVDVDAGGKVVSIIIETGNAEGMTTYRKTIDKVLASVVVARAAPKSAPPVVAAATATPVPVVAAATPTAPPLGKAERVPPSTFTNGKPQGIFLGMSLLTGKAICLLFLDGGRISRAIPESLDELHWEQHSKDQSRNCGTWSVSGETLTIKWGDGGVHTGPLKATPNGVEFYGKRYTRAETVPVAKLAGSWESAREVMDLTVLSYLEIAADGTFRWTSGLSGEVAGRAVGGTGRDYRGKLAIKNQTAIFTGDDGTVERYTFIKMPGEPTTFSLGPNLFTAK